MGAWAKMLSHSGRHADGVMIRNPAMPAIRLVTRSFMRRVEPWRRMVIASQFLCEAILDIVKAAKALTQSYAEAARW